MRDILLFDRNSESDGTINLSTITGQEKNPLVEGITRLSLEGHYNIGQLHEFNEFPAQVIMRDSSNRDQVAMRNFGLGRVIGLGFACNTRYPCMENRSVQQLILNAINSY